MGKKSRDREEAVVETADVKEPVEAAPAKAEAFSVEEKIKVIQASAMPESQKEAYIKQLSGGGSIVSPDGVPFSVYANVKKIPQGRRAAMLVYPKAKGVALATVAEWDEIFKGF